MRELLFMSLFCEKIAENVGYAENAFERIKEPSKHAWLLLFFDAF